MSATELARIVVSAIENAHQEYLEMSGGSWLWEAPEYFTTTAIAHALFKHEKVSYIELECNVRDTLRDAGATQRGRIPNRLRPAGKFDILLWGNQTNDKDELLPVAPIEVKVRPWQVRVVKQDLERLAYSLGGNPNNSMQFSMFSFYTSFEDRTTLNAKKSLEKFGEDLEDCASTIAGQAQCSETFLNGDISVIDDSAWAAGVVIFQRKSRLKNTVSTMKSASSDALRAYCNSIYSFILTNDGSAIIFITDQNDSIFFIAHPFRNFIKTDESI
ncbi:hypothetical protein HFU84_04335 [Acidithiobacillus sp. CV18-2]|uniref:Uncharacterized protein n=1 Tax=Igneacidithiobacillus copahuensis TaxID=2724909 RepID=A0AAE2YS81_9PROT|nr:hypothetical protein [Igneacidithiobacillus copahuensis]MBU2754164.1 hypothetical protein [Acidithiobacillus sp. CV18-3]MBU2758471.1 hypothetical protein [Acidithiobacillus sp. BN09-2]MBU2776744.1 hypothetical protein [Acidithiobacillus sp. CV18-2]MBU2797068.1 hypothetical protein [Acidithiobacillus sp. VAN18-2]MBU2798483.1 hypothetical protein [Acidithiobacillus sp. VAN18-4]UTV80138.1 hypothetical protein MQE22_08890 [Acidithiobacillus sp. YTS05]